MVKVLDVDRDLWTLQIPVALLRDAADMPTISRRLQSVIFDACRGLRDAADAILCVSPQDAYRVRDAVQEVS